MVADAVKAGAILFVAALVQVTVLNRLEILGGGPDLLLLALVGVSLLRGSLFGAAGGFCAGLVVDTADLGTLGLTSLVLTVAGYWIGRYGETTGRDRGHAPFLSIAVVTVLYGYGVLLDALFPSILLNLALTAPVYALCRRLLRPPELAELATEVRLLG